jgi:SPP1 gp7 family putative phage head morphogenesis protein
MTAETFVVDVATRHNVFVQRFAGGQANEAAALLARMRKAVTARMERDPTEFQANRLNLLLRDIEGLTGNSMVQLGAQLDEAVTAFASSEALFSLELGQQTTTAIMQLPSDALVGQIVRSTPMAAPLGPNAITIAEALADFGSTKSREIITTISDGMFLGDTLDTTTRRVATLIDTRQTRQVDALVRTVMNHTANQASKAVMIENAALLEGEEWVATLDGRTTLICAGRDGTIYPVGLGPYPPAHWNCRSRRVPVVKDEFAIKGLTGERPAVGDEIGTLRGDVNFGSFLKRQSAGFQDEFLGPTRGKLFRQGGLTIDRFRDETGRTYTLEQLQALNPIAFDDAGLTTAPLRG